MYLKQHSLLLDDLYLSSGHINKGSDGIWKRSTESAPYITLRLRSAAKEERTTTNLYLYSGKWNWLVSLEFFEFLPKPPNFELK